MQLNIFGKYKKFWYLQANFGGICPFCPIKNCRGLLLERLATYLDWQTIMSSIVYFMSKFCQFFSSTDVIPGQS